MRARIDDRRRAKPESVTTPFHRSFGSPYATGLATEVVPPGPLPGIFAIGVFDMEDQSILATEGECPGSLTGSLEGITASGRFAIVTADELGESILDAGPCTGTSVVLQDPELVAVAVADAEGHWSRTQNVQSSFCGRLLQAIDLETCLPTTVTQTAPR